jgi:hypothetical protein
MKIKFSSFLKEARGKMDDTVFRLCHTGEWQITSKPNMSKVRWSKAQDDHRERMAEAAAYASAAMAVPRLRELYLQIAWEKKQNNRPWDMALSDYFHNRINRLGYEGFWNAETWREDIKKRRKKNKRKQRYKDED